MGCSLMRPTHNKNFKILASSVQEIAKIKFSQSAIYKIWRRSSRLFRSYGTFCVFGFGPRNLVCELL
jgi:hypothetical protein